MTEKQTFLGLGIKPKPMKLFATWEVDRTPPNCVRRLCNVTLTRLQLTQPLGGDFSSVRLAVKMQSSKKTFGSNEIPLPTAGLLDTELTFECSLEYPHFLKREGNILLVQLQRRKKYKNRTILGFKTLATGIVNMSQILQYPVDRELELYSNGKEKSSIMGRVTMISLSSQPVDDTNERMKSFLSDIPCRDRAVDIGEYCTDDDEDYSSPEEGSDSEPFLEDNTPRLKHLRTNSRARSLPPTARQRNLKQRFIALIKRFKVTEALQAFDHDQELDSRGEVDDDEIEDLFQELEELSDSGPEVDSISISSTPKPSLRPYFSSRSLITDASTSQILSIPGNICKKLRAPDKACADRLSDESSKRADSDQMDTWTDHEQSDTQILASSPPRDDKSKSNKGKLFTRDRSNLSLKERKSLTSIGSTPRPEKGAMERSNSTTVVECMPRKVLLEQLSRLLPLEDSHLPDHLILINTGESHGPLLAGHLTENGHKVITAMAYADVRATVLHIVNKIQKFCNTNAKTPDPLKVVVVGSDNFINSVVRPYVESLSSKPRDFQFILRFLIIPLAGFNSLAKYLASLDSTYGASFVSDSWKETLERWEKSDVQEASLRIQRYLSASHQTLHLPIAEAMVTYKEKSGDDESSQAFVPFVIDVRLGTGDALSSSVDMDEPASTPTNVTVPGSPPSSTPICMGVGLEKPRDNTTPPSSPNINNSHMSNSRNPSDPSMEPLDLQVDYWLMRSSTCEEKAGPRGDGGGKFTLKMRVNSLQVSRLAPLGVVPSQDPAMSSQHLTFSFATKEKKQRIMRLGKKKEKEREMESRREVIDGVYRLLASSRNQTLKVSIDSVEWANVKFFQLSSQWQTQIKSFPVFLFAVQESSKNCS